jgi:hypothetical protein
VIKNTVKILANAIALKMFDDYCKELDKKFSDALNEAFEGERISKERVQRIGNRFINILRGVR